MKPDGAKWDLENNILTEQQHKQLYEHMPIVIIVIVFLDLDDSGR